MASRTNILASLLLVFLLGVVYLLTTRVERFETMYGARDGKAKGLECEFNDECASNVCLHYNSPEGLQHTCA